eukprot:m.223208 g.223208  ORF g.223208 m.223208 type:complete len:86 (+) comp15941_c0_seq40:62-319(+)
MIEIFLAAVAGLLQGLDNGAGRIPPMGWSSWCSAGRCGLDYCDSKIVLEAADALESTGMAQLGYSFIVLDDCCKMFVTCELRCTI